MQLIVFSEGACAECPYSGSRTHVVRDEVGDSYTGIMLVGEAPGVNEDRAARPFVGDSGQVLGKFLQLSNLSRSDLYITNAVRCRPPGNKLTAKGVRFHRQFLDAAVSHARPHTILAIGATALSAFSQDSRKLTSCHGQPFYVELPHGRTKVVPLFHPAFAMRNDKIWLPLYRDFQKLLAEPVPTVETQYFLGDDQQAAFIARSSRRIGFDIETTDDKWEGVFYPHKQMCLGYSVSARAGIAVYVPNPPDQQMKAVLEDPGVVKVTHNGKFEHTVLQNHGIRMVGFEDTKLKAYLLGHLSTHLKDLSWQLLGVKQLRLEDVLNGRSTRELTPEEWLPYAAADADVTLRIDDILSNDLVQENLETVYREFELPLVPILSDTERRGVALDESVLTELAGRLRKRRDTLESRLHGSLGNVNLNSGPQKAKVLFGEWGLPIVGKTDAGKPSLDKEVFDLWLKHPKVDEDKKAVLKELREFTQLGDYLSDFVEKLPRIAVGGTLHTSLNQAGGWEEIGGRSKESPSTGRLSSSNPNLMQIPKRDPALAAEVRRSFVARPGHVLVSADIQQEEPRLFAVASGDMNMKAVFTGGGDIYMPIAHMLKRAFTGDKTAVAGVHERDAWGLEYRDTAKNKVFLPVSYGAHAPKLMSLHPGLTRELVGVIIAELRVMYPGLVEHASNVNRELGVTGVATSHFGRKRWLPGVWYRRQHDEAVRMAVNMYPQGTGADILKGTIIRLHDKLTPLGAHLLFPVHDELVYEVPEERVADVLPIIRSMTAWFDPIELPVEVKVGKNWGEMKQ